MVVEVIDNFLDKEDFLDLKTTLLSKVIFPWYYVDYVLYGITQQNKHQEKTDFQFVHKFFLSSEVSDDNKDSFSDYFFLVKPIIKKLNPSFLYRIKANLQPNVGKKIIGGFHYDYGELDNYKTAVFYVNSNNGYTLFESGEKIKSRENRIVIFDGNKQHSGVTSTDSKVRCVININFRT